MSIKFNKVAYHSKQYKMDQLQKINIIKINYNILTESLITSPKMSSNAGIKSFTSVSSEIKPRTIKVLLKHLYELNDFIN